MQSVVFIWHCQLSALHHHTRVFQHDGCRNVLVAGLSSFLHIFVVFVAVFLPLPLPIPLLTWCLEDYMGSHGWVAGIASHRSVLLLSVWLITVEVPGYPEHLSSIQHNVVLIFLFSFALFLECKQSRKLCL